MSILEDAHRVIDAGPVCDACLGRVFADRSHGLTNTARGSALRVSVALSEDVDPEADAGPDCWVCEGRCLEYDAWAERCVDTVTDVEFDTYQVGTRVPPLVEENDRLLREDADLPADAGELFKRSVNREVGKRVGRATGTEVDFERPNVQFTLDLAADRVDRQINSAFVYGRYRKLERGIPQTEWPCRECHGSGRTGGTSCEHCNGNGYLYDRSVEELTAPVVEDVMGGTAATFHGAGREDVDARMLDTGRPFVIEVDEPRRRYPDVERLEGDINAFADGAVEVEGLRLATHEMVERVKELSASKTYRAQVKFGSAVQATALADALDTLSGATIEQDTPQRVDHRRASRTRTRKAYEATGELNDPNHAVIEIHGAGGLYIKELISSDEGHTTPSLAGLLEVEATVTALDVLSVKGEDEPFEAEEYFQE
jgi:tRNA pseudouridine synthase 10